MVKKVYEAEQSDDEEDDNNSVSEMDEEEEEYQSNSDLIEEESDDGEGSSQLQPDGFGSKKEDYRKLSDVTDSDDSGEENAADDIYREQQRILNEADFIDADFANDAREKKGADDNEDGDQQQQPAGAAEAEERDRKERLIKKLSPEIMSLARELKVSMKEINDKLLPLLEIKEAKRIMQQKGGNYLEVRNELLLAYTICILFYLILKAKGKITNNHPVLDALTKYKTYFERMNVSLDAFYSQAAQILKSTLKQDKKGVAASAKSMSFEDKMKLMAASKKQEKGKNAAAPAGKLSQKEAKALQDELKNMQGFTSDEDDEDSDDDEVDSDDEMLSEDDEDIRITKGAKAAAAVSAAAAALKKASKNNNKKKDDDEINMDSIEPWMLNDEEDKAADGGDDEGDTLFSAPKKVNMQQKQRLASAKSKGQSTLADGFEDEFYKSAKQEQSNAVLSKKAQRIKEKQARKEELSKKFEIAEIDESASRKITPQILHNKGTLVRKRKKIDGNAKLKNRLKYERKLKIHNRNHHGKIYEEKKQYFGEMGAIKSSLVKSTKL